jgi:hypothetical protein
MAGCSISGNEGDALFSNKKKIFSMTKDKASKDEDDGESFKKQYGNKKGVKCYRCGIKKDCRVKLKEAYVVRKE